METYFGIKYTFDKERIHSLLDYWVMNDKKSYVCVADGVTLAMSRKNQKLKNVLEQSGMTICDSGWVPLYLKWIYGIEREQYCGSDLLINLVNRKKYNLMFMGASESTLEALKENLSKWDNRIASMAFLPLPFCEIGDFNYAAIAESIKENNPDVIFVSLGMPKQEFFMHRLLSFIDKGILIGVGAAFKFHSGLPNQKRAPQWMLKMKLEWVHRIFNEPQKQIKRCLLILITMPVLFLKELRKVKKEGNGN